MRDMTTNDLLWIITVFTIIGGIIGLLSSVNMVGTRCDIKGESCDFVFELDNEKVNQIAISAGLFGVGGGLFLARSLIEKKDTTINRK